MLQIAGELGEKLRVPEVALVGDPQFVQRLHQGLGDEDTARRTEMSVFVGQVAESYLTVLHCAPRA